MSVISQIFMLTWAVEVSFIPELYLKVSVRNCHLSRKVAEYYWFQGPVVFMESAKDFKTLTFLRKYSKRDKSITARQTLHKNICSRSILKYCKEASNIVPDL